MCIGHAAGATAHANEFCSSRQEFYPLRWMLHRPFALEELWFKIKRIRCNSQVFMRWNFDSSMETNKEPADGRLIVTQAAEISATTSCCITLLEDTHSHLVGTSDNTFDWRQVTDVDYLCAAPGCGVFQEIKRRAFAVLYLCCIY